MWNLMQLNLDHGLDPTDSILESFPAPVVGEGVILRVVSVE